MFTAKGISCVQSQYWREENEAAGVRNGPTTQMDCVASGGGGCHQRQVDIQKSEVRPDRVHNDKEWWKAAALSQRRHQFLRYTRGQQHPLEFHQREPFHLETPRIPPDWRARAAGPLRCCFSNGRRQWPPPSPPF